MDRYWGFCFGVDCIAAKKWTQLEEGTASGKTAMLEYQSAFYSSPSLEVESHKKVSKTLSISCSSS